VIPVEIIFSGSPRASLGVEWELELVDRETRELRSGATAILGRIGPADGREHPKAKYELLESCVEVITGICGTVAEALGDLSATVAEVRRAAAAEGLDVMCSGSHPFTDWSTQVPSPNPRYGRLIDQMQWMARQMQIFGVHVHVGVRSADKAVTMVNALRAYVPHLLALSASSPYWIGTDTGLASYRSKVFEGLPTAGLPYVLTGWPEFEEFMETLISAGAISSIKEVWWDIRPHPDFGTVEFRICDGLPTAFEVGAVAALSQCLVARMDAQIDAGQELVVPHEWVARENKWRAARHGLEADIIVDETGRTEPLRQALPRLVAELEPTAEELGCAAELAGALEIMADGPSYLRQRRVAAAHHGDLRAVVDSLVAEMQAGRPAPVQPDPTAQPATARPAPAQPDPGRPARLQ
jgi:carboxylate-amine ligase